MKLKIFSWKFFQRKKSVLKISRTCVDGTDTLTVETNNFPDSQRLNAVVTACARAMWRV